MVNQAEQPIENTPVSNDIGNTTTDITSDFEGFNTFDDVDTSPTDLNTVTTDTTDITDTTETTEDTSNTDTPPPAPVAEEPEPQIPTPDTSNMDNMQQRIRENEAKLNEYQQAQYQQQMQQQVDTYRQQLEKQGYLPDQAEQISSAWQEQQGEMARIRQEQEQYIQFVRGQAAAAEHFAKQYNLGLEDLDQLRKYDNPQSMEEAAKDIKSRREDKAEIARLRAAQVPSQNFDNSQSSPAASNNEDRWLDRYNQGDRSEQAQAAARRAAGLG